MTNNFQSISTLGKVNCCKWFTFVDDFDVNNLFDIALNEPSNNYKVEELRYFKLNHDTNLDYFEQDLQFLKDSKQKITEKDWSKKDINNEQEEKVMREQVDDIVDRLKNGVTYYFATGTKDFYEDNKINLFSYFLKESYYQPNNLNGSQTQLKLSIPHEGNVNDIEMYENERLISASSNGSINLYDLTINSDSSFDYSKVYSYKPHNSLLGGCSKSKLSPSTSISSNTSVSFLAHNNINGPILSSGYDGIISLCDINHQYLVFKNKIIDAPIRDINWFSPSLATAACNAGVFKLLDLRNPSSIGLTFHEERGDHNAPTGDLTCIAHHPDRFYTFAVGNANGGISVFDLRNLGKPTLTKISYSQYLPKRHNNAVKSVNFLPSNPDYVISASSDQTICASVWQKDQFSQPNLSIDQQFRIPYDLSQPIPYTNSKYSNLFKTFNQFHSPLLSMDFHPVTSLCLSGSNDGTLFLGTLPIAHKNRFLNEFY